MISNGGCLDCGWILVDVSGCVFSGGRFGDFCYHLASGIRAVVFEKLRAVLGNERGFTSP